MIPVNPLAILIGTLIMLLSVISLIALLTLAVLWLWPRTRPALRRRPRSMLVLTLLLVLLAAPGVSFKWQLARDAAEHAAHQRALNPRLAEPLRLDEIDFPVGTQVRLERIAPQADWQTGEPMEYGLATLQEATFEKPVDILGLRVQHLSSPSNYFFSTLRLAQAAVVEGWPCAAGSDVEFHRETDARLTPSQWRFRSCELQAGAQLGGLPWPQGSYVLESEGRWSLRYSSSDGRSAGASLAYAGMQLSWLDLQLDEQRQPLSWQGALAEPHRHGPMRYESRAEVRQTGAGPLIFSPRRHAARNQLTQGQVEPGQSVVQAADGEVLGVLRNAELGIIDWTEFE